MRSVSSLRALKKTGSSRRFGRSSSSQLSTGSTGTGERDSTGTTGTDKPHHRHHHRSHGSRENSTELLSRSDSESSREGSSHQKKSRRSLMNTNKSYRDSITSITEEKDDEIAAEENIAKTSIKDKDNV